jgi:hypothetical protein
LPNHKSNSMDVTNRCDEIPACRRQSPRATWNFKWNLAFEAQGLDGLERSSFNDLNR